MKVNNRQLLLISFDEADFEGRLHYKKTSIFWNNDNKGFKERWFKLKHNMLFYFKMNETYPMLKEPAGVFILESYDVKYEENEEVPFSFSITFNYEPDVKYLFSARSDDVVFSWISVLQNSSFGHLKEKLENLQKKIQEKTGKEEKITRQARRQEERIFNFSNLNIQLETLNLNYEKTELESKSKKETNNSNNSLPVNKVDKDSTKSELNLILL